MGTERGSIQQRLPRSAIRKGLGGVPADQCSEKLLYADAGGSVPVIAMTALVTHADRARIPNASRHACRSLSLQTSYWRRLHLAIPCLSSCSCHPPRVPGQIETTTEPGASGKGFAGAYESTTALECGCARSMRTPKNSSGLGVPKTRRSLPEPLVRRQAPSGQQRFPASPRSLEESIGRRVGFP